MQSPIPDSAQWRAYVFEGLRQIARYLAKWAAFDEYCRDHGIPPR